VGLEKAKIVNVSTDPEGSIDVLFNPTDYGINRGANYTEMQVPGLRTPILQFIRGEAQTLDVELFLDGTNKRQPVEDDLAKLRTFISIDGELHAPPVCRFEWGAVRFQGVVTSLKEKFQLFAEDGRVIRARVTLSIKSYESAEVQLRELRRSSPDRTRVRTFREGESLALIAHETYGDPRLWRLIALENDIQRPRFIAPGTPLRIPIDTRRT
jgi:nucleoid-associated protein YgaU